MVSQLTSKSYGEPGINPATSVNVANCATRLLEYCRKNNWAGVDPYDALNSRLLDGTPFIKSRIFRIAVTQTLKRLPFDIRSSLLIYGDQNPKAISLFLMALIRLKRAGVLKEDGVIMLMLERLMALRSPGIPLWCWGYSFPWQTRTILVPRWFPNIVCTSFAANALLDAYEEYHEAECLRMAMNAGEYILSSLYWTSSDGTASFSYPLPGLQSRVHNANFLAAALLSRLHQYSSEAKFLDAALRVARYSAREQHNDGSWAYGEHATQKWIDNFHTGYNLCALRTIGMNAKTGEFEGHLARGFEFYRKHFFTKEGVPKYFHNRIYPIDIHSVAQSLITLVSLRDLDQSALQLAEAVWNWSFTHMWDARGYFYYRVLRFWTVKISYMRWSQAWMALALATVLDYDRHNSTEMVGIA